MVITEIFKSIQGEGTRAGLPCIFVRLTGCNLRCTWCYTAYAFHGGKKMSVEDVAAGLEEINGAPVPGKTTDGVEGMTRDERPLQEVKKSLRDDFRVRRRTTMIATWHECG